MQDAVIKYQTVRLDEDLKRQKKLVEQRDKRTARRPRRATAPAAVRQLRIRAAAGSAAPAAPNRAPAS